MILNETIFKKTAFQNVDVFTHAKNICGKIGRNLIIYFWQTSLGQLKL